MKKINWKEVKVVRLAVGIICLLSLLTMIGYQLTWQIGDPSIRSEIVKISFSEMTFGKVIEKSVFIEIVKYIGNPTGFVGYIFVGLGGLLALVTTFSKDLSPKRKFIDDILINLFLITGGVCILLQRDAFLASNQGYVDSTLALTAWPIVAATTAFASSLAMVIGIIVDK